MSIPYVSLVGPIVPNFSQGYYVFKSSSVEPPQPELSLYVNVTNVLARTNSNGRWNLQSGPGVGQWSIRDLESNLYFGYNYDLAIEAVTEEVFWTIVFSPPNFPNHYQLFIPTTNLTPVLDWTQRSATFADGAHTLLISEALPSTYVDPFQCWDFVKL